MRQRLVVVFAITAILGGLGVAAGARGAPSGRYIVGCVRDVHFIILSEIRAKAASRPGSPCSS